MTTAVREFTIRNYYEREIPLDDGLEGDAVDAGTTFPIRVRRFSIAQLQEFQRGFARLKQPTAARFIARKPDGEEQEQRSTKYGLAYVISDAEVLRRRVQEMTADERAVYQAASDADDAYVMAFAPEAIRAHVWVPPDVKLTFLVPDEQTGEEQPLLVKTGDDLVKAFGGNLSMLLRLVSAINEENTLSAEEKKTLRRLSRLITSFQLPDVAAAIAGDSPAATAASVAPPASVENADV